LSVVKVYSDTRVMGGYFSDIQFLYKQNKKKRYDQKGW